MHTATTIKVNNGYVSSGSQRFALKDDELDTVKGKVALTGEPIFPAHPAEMDAKEILLWEKYLKGYRIRPAFQQMEEPVVLNNGKLTGSLRSVESGGRTYTGLSEILNGCGQIDEPLVIRILDRAKAKLKEIDDRD